MTHVHRLHRDARSLQGRLPNPDQRMMQPIVDLMGAMAAAESGPDDKIGIRDYIRADVEKTLKAEGLTGPIAEVGGSRNGLAAHLPEHDFIFLSLYPTDDPATVVADITNCPQIPSASFDAVVSVACFEHVERPWRAAEEITRILKPGGISYHVAPFSYFYHCAPVDYWRYSPDALAFLFRDLEPLRTEFYGANRRRNNTGSELKPIDSHGEPQFAIDGFGGWRENWHAIYVGRKTPGWLARRDTHDLQQAVIDIAKVLSTEDVPDDELGTRTSSLLSCVCFNARGEMVATAPGHGLAMRAEECGEVWRNRGKLGLKPSFLRYSRVAIARAASSDPSSPSVTQATRAEQDRVPSHRKDIEIP